MSKLLLALLAGLLIVLCYLGNTLAYWSLGLLIVVTAVAFVLPRFPWRELGRRTWIAGAILLLFAAQGVYFWQLGSFQAGPDSGFGYGSRWARLVVAKYEVNVTCDAGVTEWQVAHQLTIDKASVAKAMDARTKGIAEERSRLKKDIENADSDVIKKSYQKYLDELEKEATADLLASVNDAKSGWQRVQDSPRVLVYTRRMHASVERSLFFPSYTINSIRLEDTPFSRADNSKAVVDAPKHLIQATFPSTEPVDLLLKDKDAERFELKSIEDAWEIRLKVASACAANSILRYSSSSIALPLLGGLGVVFLGVFSDQIRRGLFEPFGMWLFALVGLRWRKDKKEDNASVPEQGKETLS